MLCPELVRGLSLDESIIFCETLPIRLVLDNSQCTEAWVTRLALKIRAGHPGNRWMEEHTVLEHLGNLGVILLAVLLSTSVHYLFLKHLNRGARLALKFPQIRLDYGVIVSLVAHSIEVALFAIAYRVSIESGFGTLEGNFEGSIADHLYFSYAAFTTEGFGDIVPTGPLRLLAGMEALTGFVLITWTARICIWK